MQDKIDKILDKLTEQAVQLARIEERITPALDSIKHLEKEVDSLKRWKWTVAGGVAVISLGAQFILKQLVK